ncbi:MAG: hypothetical protein KF829_10365 [Ferruginibacter sp.]|nr:hypothetical protein [Ferruginibacter sp.]
MKLLSFILVFILLACGNNKSRTKITESPVLDALAIRYDAYGTPILSDSAVKANARRFNEEPFMAYGGFKTPPACIREMITRFSGAPVTQPPRKIFLYDYKGKIVFYVPAICCDFFSDLYDMDCHLIGHPDGGITGRGDGSFPDFINERTKEVLIWEDSRGR